MIYLLAISHIIDNAPRYTRNALFIASAGLVVWLLWTLLRH